MSRKKAKAAPTRRAQILIGPIPLADLRRKAGGPLLCRCGKPAEYAVESARTSARAVNYRRLMPRCATCAALVAGKHTALPGSRLHAARVLDGLPWAAR